MVDWYNDWLIDWLMEWLIDWLSDWLINTLPKIESFLHKNASQTPLNNVSCTQNKFSRGGNLGQWLHSLPLSWHRIVILSPLSVRRMARQWRSNSARGPCHVWTATSPTSNCLNAALMPPALVDDASATRVRRATGSTVSIHTMCTLLTNLLTN
jgi:hypothetical protein